MEIEARLIEEAVNQVENSTSGLDPKCQLSYLEGSSWW